MMEALCALLVQGAFTVLAAVVARGAKPIALAFGAIGFFVVPWFAGPIALLGGLLALLGFVNLLRIVDVVRFGDAWSAGRRVLHVASFVDSRTLRPSPRKVDFATIGRGLLWAVPAVAAFWLAQMPRPLVRWGSGLVF